MHGGRGICNGACEGGFLEFGRVYVKPEERDFLEAHSEQNSENEGVVISVKGWKEVM